MREKSEDRQIRSWVHQIHEEEMAAYSDMDLSDAQPSDQFYREMEQVIGRQRRIKIRRRAVYGTAAAAAAVALVLWLGTHPGTDVQALDMVIQWEDLYVYFSIPDADKDYAAPEYTLSYVPEGCTLYEHYYDGPRFGGGELYFDESGHLGVSFDYMPGGGVTGLNSEYVIHHQVELPDGLDAHYLESENPDYASSLVWQSKDGQLLFSMTGYLDYEEFVRIYEGITLVE